MPVTLEAVDATLTAVKDIVTGNSRKLAKINGHVDDHETRLALLEQAGRLYGKARGLWVHLLLLIAATVIGGVFLMAVSGFTGG